MTELPFIKMQGLGNDFVIVDARPGRPAAGIMLDDRSAAAIANRHRGVGCDQLIVLEMARDETDVFMRIRNSDGGEVGACGNATRCVGHLLMNETGQDDLHIQTVAGRLRVFRADNGQVTVDMGRPEFSWDRIPLAKEMETLHLDLSWGGHSDPAAANLGNPHATFFVDNAEAVAIDRLGPELENHPLFPEGANIGMAQILATGDMRLRVWERGAGLTQACGTAACAAVVNAHRRGLMARSGDVHMDGGQLRIEWLDNNHVCLTGPVNTSFTGLLDATVLQ